MDVSYDRTKAESGSLSTILPVRRASSEREHIPRPEARTDANKRPAGSYTRASEWGPFEC